MEHIKSLTFGDAFSFLRLLHLNATATFFVHRKYKISRPNSSFIDHPTFPAQL